MKFSVKKIKSYFMTGLSYMIPVVIIGGMFTAISLGIGADANDGMSITSQFWKDMKAVGDEGMFMMIPVLCAYIAYAIGGKPALAPGFIMGYLANTSVGANEVKTGFLGAMLMGLGIGIFVLWLKKVKFPKALQSIVPLFIIPLATTLVFSILYIEIFATPIGAALNGMVDVLTSISTAGNVLIAIIIGCMLAFDMGGPINKTCCVFLLATYGAGQYQYMGMFGVAAAVPSIGMGIATFMSRKKYTSSEKDAGIASFIMGCCGLTEGAIPLAVSDPMRVIPSIMVGASVGSVIAALAGCLNYVGHGGLIVLPAVTEKLMYVIAIIIGSLVTAIMVNLLKKPIADEKETSK